MTTGSTHLYILGVFSLGDADHPEEFVDVVSGVTDHTSEDDENVVDSECPHDMNCLLLSAGHGLPYQGYVAVVPGVIVHESGSVTHPWREGQTEVNS